MTVSTSSLLSNTNPFAGNNAPVSPAGNAVSSNAVSSNLYFTREKSFIISARGLRPSTQHFFYFGNTNLSTLCAPLMSSNTLNNSNNSLTIGLLPLGTALQSDSQGAIKFVFFLNSGLNANSNFNARQILANNVRGPVTCTIKTADGSSSATMTLNIIKGVGNTSVNFALPVFRDATGNSILSSSSATFN